MLIVNVDGIDTAIVGYFADKQNKPMAVLAPWPNPDGSFGLKTAALSELTLPTVSEKVRRKLRRATRERARAAGVEVKP